MIDATEAAESSVPPVRPDVGDHRQRDEAEHVVDDCGAGDDPREGFRARPRP
jgi:hypothetical protein